MDDAEREVAGRRRDLEREFDAKLRDLKSQTKRLADSLEQDRRAWEEHKRAQQKELADREERLRRHDGNLAKTTAGRTALADEAEDLRARVGRLEEEKLKAKVAREAAEERTSRAAQAATRSRSYLATLSAFVVAMAAAWLLVTVQDGNDPLVPGVFATCAVALVVLALRHRRHVR